MTDQQQLNRNKEIVEAFMTLCGTDPRKAADLYMADGYINHDHGVDDGKAAWLALVDDHGGLTEEMREQAELDEFQGGEHGLKVEIKRIIAEDDLVVLHLHVVPKPGDAGLAVFDMFRVTDEKITEHWNCVMPVPTEGYAGTTPSVF